MSATTGSAPADVPVDRRDAAQLVDLLWPDVAVRARRAWWLYWGLFVAAVALLTATGVALATSSPTVTPVAFAASATVVAWQTLGLWPRMRDDTACAILRCATATSIVGWAQDGELDSGLDWLATLDEDDQVERARARYDQLVTDAWPATLPTVPRP